MTDLTTDPKFINPPNTLKIKVGHGGIAPELLKRGQQLIEENPVDITPFCLENIQELKDLIAEYKADPTVGQQRPFINRLSIPIMGLKSNGGMFQYPLISLIADVALQFFDRLGYVDEESIEILKAHNISISTILSHKLKGYAGKEGQAIVMELQEACDRYYKKHNIK